MYSFGALISSQQSNAQETTEIINLLSPKLEEQKEKESSRLIDIINENKSPFNYNNYGIFKKSSIN